MAGLDAGTRAARSATTAMLVLSTSGASDGVSENDHPASDRDPVSTATAAGGMLRPATRSATMARHWSKAVCP